MAPWAEVSRYLIRDREAYGAAVIQLEAEYSEHPLWCPLRLERRIEVLPHGRSQLIPMSLLHSVTVSISLLRDVIFWGSPFGHSMSASTVEQPDREVEDRGERDPGRQREETIGRQFVQLIEHHNGRDDQRELRDDIDQA